MNCHANNHHNTKAEAIYAERVAPVDALHVACDDDRKVRERAKQLVIEKSRAAGEVLLLTGAPMSGRSQKICQLATAPWLAPTLHPDGKKEAPILEIDGGAQSQTDKWTIVDAITGADDSKASAQSVQRDRRLLQHAKANILSSGHRLIAITNAGQMLRDKKVRQLQAIAGKISLFTSETKVSFIMTGDNELLTFVRAHVDLIGSVSHIPMQPIRGYDEFVDMLKAFANAGGLHLNEKLRGEALVGALMDLTQGLHGRAAHLLREATKAAIFDDVDTLSVDHLVKVVDRVALAIGENPLLRLL